MKTFESSHGRITVRRISWAEFFRLRPDLRPANDNRPPVGVVDNEVRYAR